MKKMKKMRWLAAVLNLLMILGLANYVMSSASGEPEVVTDENDITQYVDISLNDFFIQTRSGENFIKKYIYQDGQPTNSTGDDYALKINGIVAMSYKWGIKSENMAKVKDGSYFTFTLPDQSILDAGEELRKDLYDTTSKRIGHFSVNADGVVKVVLEGDFSTTSVLKNGIIGVFAKVKSVEIDKIVFNPKSEASTAFVLPVVTKDPTKVKVGSDSDNGIFNNPTYHNALGPVSAFKKEAQQLEPSNHIQFTFRVNYEDIRSIYEKRADGTEPTGDKAYKVKQNVYIVDEEMADGLEFVPNSTSVQIYYWAPKVDADGRVTKELSNQTIDSEAVSVHDGKITLGDKTLFTIREGSGTKEDWVAFRDGIIRENEVDKNSRIIGVFNKKYLVVTVGDMPNDQIRYGDYYNNPKYYDASKGIHSGADYLNKVLFPRYEKQSAGNKRITAEQSKYMQNAYSGKPIVDFVLRMKAIPVGETKGNYSNTAYMKWKDAEKITGTGSVKMAGAFGIVEMEPFKGNYTVTKEWKGAKKDSVKIYLLADGVVKKSEVLNETNGWKHIFTELPEKKADGSAIEYSVKEEEVAGYRSVVEPVSGKYASVIKNFEQRDITLTKKWLDDKDMALSNPGVEEVTFYLHNEKEATKTAENVLKTVVLKKDENFEKTVVVDKTDASGDEINYVVSEKEVEGFAKKGDVEGDMANGFVLTNKKNAPLVTTPPTTENTAPSTTVVTTPPAVELTTPPAAAVQTPVLVVIPPEDEVTVSNSTLPSGNTEVPSVAESIYTSHYTVPVVTVVNEEKNPEDSHTETIISSGTPIIIENNTVIPASPAVVTPDEDEELDIDILGDHIPRGDTDIEEEEELENDDLEVDGDDVPAGNQNVKNPKMLLAKTGGLMNVFLPVLGMLLVLIVSLLTVQFMIKKSK